MPWKTSRAFAIHFAAPETGTPCCGKTSDKVTTDTDAVTCRMCGSSPFYLAACRSQGKRTTAPQKSEYGNAKGYASFRATRSFR